MKAKLALLAIVLMICSVIAVPVSAAQAGNMNCGNCQAQGEQKEKKGCCAEKKKDCDGQKKAECEKDKDKDAQEQSPAESEG